MLIKSIKFNYSNWHFYKLIFKNQICNNLVNKTNEEIIIKKDL